MLALLRALPVRGYDVILGSSGAAALTLASAVIALMLAGAIATAGSNQPPLPSEHRALWFAAALLVIGPVSLAGILLQNAAVILLPGWSRLTARRGTATALGTNLANSALTILLLMSPAGRPLCRWGSGSGGRVVVKRGCWWSVRA